MKDFEKLINIIVKRDIEKSEFFKKLQEVEEVQDYCELENIEYLKLLGFPLIVKKNLKLGLSTRQKYINEQEFCVVDIETNGNNPNNAQIIEIGAVKIKNGKELDEFHTLVYSDNVPEAIEELTGISQNDLKNAPSLKKVLSDFRLFLLDSVFVAHNVKFDYRFISESMNQAGFGMLLNRRICTIDLSKKIIQTEKYGLSHLKELLKINTGQHHRALSDAKSCAEILKFCIRYLPENIKTTEELIEFSLQKQERTNTSKSIIK